MEKPTKPYSHNKFQILPHTISDLQTNHVGDIQKTLIVFKSE